MLMHLSPLVLLVGLVLLLVLRCCSVQLEYTMHMSGNIQCTSVMHLIAVGAFVSVKSLRLGCTLYVIASEA